AIAGTSMGGVIGALYAAGLSAAEIERQVLVHASASGIRRMIDISLSYRGIVRGERIYNLIADTIGSDLTFADLDLPLAMVAVDAVSGTEVLLDQGRVVDAVRATISVPGIFQPVEVDNMVLIDGGILNNVPTDIAYRLGAEAVLAVDVMPDFSRNTPGEPLVEAAIDPPSLPNVLQEALHIEYIMISALTRCKLAAHPPDVLLRPGLEATIDLLIGFDRAQEIIDAGESAAEAALPAIRTAIDR
ncbi:MAG: patatin-like phospholipase family protein, partial [Candidatus Promineifilaceae bacterium]